MKLAVGLKCVIPTCLNNRCLYNAYCSMQCEFVDIDHKYATRCNLFNVDGFFGPPWPIGFSQDSLDEDSIHELNLYRKDSLKDMSLFKHYDLSLIHI